MKKIKDPIYGYIKFDETFIKIIDTANFQRLRYIIQTSYASLYPSSSHNRFTHSLGVYFLGQLACNGLLKNSDEKYKNLIKKKSKIFLLACLLHDLGHAPFSHTGEKFYFENKIGDKPVIWTELLKKVSQRKFKKDAGNDPIGKEHEIMSALLSLNLFSDEIGNDRNRAFFARCIIGLKYKDLTDETIVENAFIELLNSNIIDIDKLDYIIRDSYMSGFNSVTIDFTRLLQYVGICNTKPYICYGKQSISTIESVINAHDMERKWIQVHPTILYESFLIQQMIRHISANINTNEQFFFSYDSLLDRVSEFKYSIANVSDEQTIKIRLLSDDDVLFLAKNIFQFNMANELYARKERMHPIWKTESEYRLFFNSKIQEKQNKIFVNLLKSIEDDLINNTYRCNIIDQTLLDKYTDEYTQIKEHCNEYPYEPNKSTLVKKLKIQKNKKELLETFKRIHDNQGIPFEFVVITQNQFKSNINKSAFRKLQIDVGGNSPEDLEKLVFISDKEAIDDGFFYIYYRRMHQINIAEVVKELISFAAVLES